MQERGHLFFKILLNRFQPDAREKDLKNLPSEEIKEVFKHATTYNDPSTIFSLPAKLLSRTHYSWFAPTIHLMPNPIQGLLVRSFPKNQAEGLSRLLDIPIHTEKAPSSLIKKFLLTQFYSLWNREGAIPADFLPASSLAPLLSCSKKELVELCDFLGLYDLAEAIRHIVDRRYLKALYLCLNPKKQQFLRICLHKKEKIRTPRLNIEQWDQKPESLYAMLHKRGLLRLGKAMCGQSHAFAWQIIHTLDTGRGSMLSKLYTAEEIPGVTPVLAQQLLSLINFLKQAVKA